MLRIAFLTHEFVIEQPDYGGPGNYLNRITQALRDLGHQPEVFTRREYPETPAVVDLNGVRVEHVDIVRNRFLWCLQRLDHRFLHSPSYGLGELVGGALGLARALERRHRQAPFDFVQSTNIDGSGLFVRRIKSRPHLARLSSDQELFSTTDGFMTGLGARLMVWLERASLRRADVLYAPSQFMSNYYRQRGRRDVMVVRPPGFLEMAPAQSIPVELPQRFLIHCGSIGPLKGSDWLAEALLEVWKSVPDFTMVWVGPERKGGEMQQYRAMWGRFADKVVWLGAIEKPSLYAVLKSAEAAVLPSRVDNLPNMVIESLLLGVPVIGSNGASIDELVEPGRSGELVPIGDKQALAEAMLRVWHRKAPWLGAGFTAPSVLTELAPEIAAANLIRLAGFETETGN